MNRNKYQIDSIVNIISDWKFENNSFYEDSEREREQTIQTQNKYCSKHCYNVNKAKKLDYQLAQQLAQWALQKNIKLNALSDLLTILRKNNHQFLPQCAKTVLKTPKNTTSLIKNFKAGGEFWYHGILSGLKTVLCKELENALSDIIEIDVFFDGFSPHNSIRQFLWPIAGFIVGRKEVFIIAIWCGKTKNPSDLDAFLEDFIDKTQELMNVSLCTRQVL